MIMKKIYWIFIVILLAGCSAKVDVVGPQDDSSRKFTKEAIHTKSVGNYILKRVNLLLYPEFASEEEINFPKVSYVSLSPLPAGTRLKVVWKYEDGSFLCVPISGVTIVNTRAAEPFPAGLVIDPNGKLKGFAYCHHPEYPLKYNKFTTISFRKTDIITSVPLHSEIVYNGRSNNKIKLLYREFEDDAEHPVFYQKISHDLSESKMITFKNTKIEVIEATNSIIRYRIIEASANWNAN